MWWVRAANQWKAFSSSLNEVGCAPAWHAARLAALSNVQRKSWEEFKAEQKAEAALGRQAEAETEEAQRAFRAQLDADRARKLSHGVNQADLRTVLEAKDKKRKKKDKKEDKKKRRGKRKRSSSKKESKRSKKKSSKDKKRKSKSKRRRRSRSRSKSDDSSSSDGSGSSSDGSSSPSSSSDSDSEARRERRREEKRERKNGGDDDGKGSPDEALRLSSFLTSGGTKDM